MAVNFTDFLSDQLRSAEKLLVRCWQQWGRFEVSPDGIKHHKSGGIATAQDLYDYLHYIGLINKDGSFCDEKESTP